MRRYTPNEMREILKLADELREPSPGASGESITLSEMQSVASELGLDPSKVALAAAQYESGRRVGEKPDKWVHHHVRQLPFVVGGVGWERMADQMQAYLGTVGTFRERVDGSHEWSSANNGERILAKLSNDGSTSQIDITSNRGEARALIIVFWSILFFLTLIIGLGASSKQGISATDLMTLLTFLGAEVALLFGLLKSSSKRAERRFKGLADQLEAAALADQPLYSSLGTHTAATFDDVNTNQQRA